MARDRKALTVLASLGGVAVMIGLVVASVPLYDLFCRVTGYGGTTTTAAAAPAATSERTLTVRFDANVVRGVPWRFAAGERQTTVRLGEEHLTWYVAENTSDEPVIGTATFNVTPAKAGQYFAKIECFCFTEQRLEPGQRIEMPVSFYVDPAIAADRNTRDVGTITLSYTFFRAKTAERATSAKDDRS